ncbi:MAG: group II intron reverse transcriptase/maturase [Gammaproteobacteria bacterium]
MKQRKTDGTQLALDFTSSKETSIPSPNGNIRNEAGGRKGADLISMLERRRALTSKWMEEIVSYENLTKSYRQVIGNGGSSGVDGMETKELKEWLRGNLPELRRQLLSGEYEPMEVRQVEIPKSNGGTRILGIPTVIDRLIQQAIHQKLSPLYEEQFSENSYGFRPSRNALQAVTKASEFVSEGYTWVVDIDLSNFFDTINHDRLMHRLYKGIGDKTTLKLIHKYLKSGMMKDGLVTQRIAGTPQGGPLSPLLSNIVLDELDKELEARGHKFCRYADDCNIYVRSEAAGLRVMESITRFIEGKLKLRVNREKSGVRKCEKCKFLGYTIMENGKIRIADKSIARFKDRIREITRRNRGISTEALMTELNRVTRGWINYYRLANTHLPLRDMDSWIRRKLRTYILKQKGGTFAIFKFLMNLGATRGEGWIAWYNKSWWRLSGTKAANKYMGLKYFDQIGFRSLTNQFAMLKI